MIRSTALVTLLCLSALPALGGNDDPATDLLREQLAPIAELEVAEIWTRALSVRDAADELEVTGLDAAGARMLRNPGEVGGAGVVFLSSVLLQGDDPDMERLAQALTPVLDETRTEIAVASAGLLGNAAFRILPRSAKEDVLLALGRKAQDGDAAPSLRVECSQSLFKLGGGSDKRVARGVMKSFLESSDAELRAQGALALASVGSIVEGDLRDELERLAKQPTPEGKLAASYIDQEEIRAQGDRKLRDLERLHASREAPDDVPETSARSDSMVAKFQAVLEMVENYHLEGGDVDSDRMLDAAMDGMLRALDEHSSFMDAEAYSRFEQDLEAAYGGIGAYVAIDPDDRLFTITRPIFSGPAYKAGLQSDDKIVRVDEWPTLNEPTDDVIKRLKGRPGTSVKLYIWRRGMDGGLIDRPNEEMSVTVVRDTITIPPVQSQLLPGKVGLVALREFSRVAAYELHQHISALKEQGANAFVLDLRWNSGGLLDQAVDVSGLFLPRGSVAVSTESRIEATRTLRTRFDPLLPEDVPLAVLVNRFSASASEIVAGALQDHDRALVIGERSFGKGSVQNLLRLQGYRDDRYDDQNKNGRRENYEPLTRDYDKDGEFDYAPRIKMTIARYLLPSGRSIHRELDDEGNVLSAGGVDPDIEVSARRYETWRLEEMVRLRNSRAPREYVDQHIDLHQDLLSELADNDQKDPSRYPDFEEFYEGLNTALPEDDVRFMVRTEVRRRIQDLRGAEFPPGDFVEDVQLQEGIRQVLEGRGDSVDDVPMYAACFEPPAEVRSQRLAGLDNASLQTALDNIAALRRGSGELSEEDLALITEILRSRLDD